MKKNINNKFWKTASVIILIFGTITLLFSIQTSQQVLEKLHEEVMGSYTDSTRWHITIGVAMVIAGIIGFFFPWHKLKK